MVKGKLYPQIEHRNNKFMIIKNKDSLGRSINKKTAKKLLKTGRYRLLEVSYGFGRDLYSLRESKIAARYL